MHLRGLSLGAVCASLLLAGAMPAQARTRVGVTRELGLIDCFTLDQALLPDDVEPRGWLDSGRFLTFEPATDSDDPVERAASWSTWFTRRVADPAEREVFVERKWLDFLEGWAGYPDGVTIKTIHTTLPGMLATIEAVQALLKKSNINLEITPVEHATFHQQIRQDLSQLVHYSAARFPVADVYLTQFFHSKSIVGTDGAIANFSHCNVADAEIDAARVEQDMAKQKALWKEAQRKIIEAVCGVPVYENMQLWAWKDNLDLGYELKGSLNLSPPITEATHFTD